MCAAAALAGCRAAPPPQTAKLSEPTVTAAVTQVHASPKLRGVQSPLVDNLGRPITVACANCHSLRKSDVLPASTADLDEFHRGLTFAHGSLRCASCHVPGRVDVVHLADGPEVPIDDAIQLCGQCHGPQLSSYTQGAHGGMNGHWDTSRGDRVKNHCVDCHDPHQPAFQPTVPVLPPKDRLAQGAVHLTSGAP